MLTREERVSTSDKAELGGGDSLLPALERLSLDDNALTGLPPKFAQRAAHLQELRLAGNAPLPESLAIDCENASAVTAWIALLESQQ